jgi:serine-type D-Ala-D-Ala carboxypeptidase/endopeptidase (penicillin-binding protein 4)
MPRSRRVLPLLALFLAAAAFPAPAATAASPQANLKKALGRAMAQASAASGAYVVDADTGATVFGWKSGTKRILASNTKMFTNATALARQGPGAQLETRVLGRGARQGSIWTGDLYLRGAGDPALGSDGYNQARYSGGTSVEALADQIAALGITRVAGAIVGDESRWDSFRGTAYSAFAGSGDIGGPLTALSYNHARGADGRFQINPPVYAAARFADALRAAGVKVDDSARRGTAPDDAVQLAAAESLPMARLAQITGIRSENWFAEMLLKGLPGAGSTRDGAADARRYARSLGASASVVDGSGLSRSNKAAPREVVDFLIGVRDEPAFDSFYAALPTAGVNGTLVDRMRSGPARGRCHAKTGTIVGVTTLSGYCESLGGDLFAFSLLMNNSSTTGGRKIQDRMAQAIAGYGS